MIGPERMLAPLAYALAGSEADQTEIAVEVTHQGVTRYARSQIHQTSVVEDTRIWVRAAAGKSLGSASGNSLDREALRTLVEAATAVARTAPPNPEFVGFAEPEEVSAVRGFDAVTATTESEARAKAIGAIVETVSEEGWQAAGTYLTEGRELAVVNSRGVSAYAPHSMAFLRALAQRPEGSGYADTLSYRTLDIAPGSVARKAMVKCELNVDQREIPPGEYEAIFEDLCVAEMLTALAGSAFGAQAYEQGTSFLSGRTNDVVTGRNVTIWDDGTDRRSLAVAADYEGVPKRKLSLIDGGIARGVAYDSYTAHKAGRQSTGHATDPDRSYYGPMPTNLFMAGGEASIDDMIRATKRGLLVTRFHYTHVPDRKRAVLTGTTRDGTFLVENGEIVGAVKNLRLTHSIPDLFEGIEMLGRPRLCQDWWSSNGMGRVSSVCPPIKVGRAIFTSGTLF